MTFKRETFRMDKPIAANYVTPSGVMCVQVMIPDDVEHVAILQGLMAQVTNPENWQGTEADRAQLAYLWEVPYVLTDWGQCVTQLLPTINLFSVNASVSGGALTFTQGAFMPFGYSMDTDIVANRNIRHNVWLPVGTYECIWHYAKTVSSGNADLLLTDDSGSVYETIANNIDMYGLFNARFVNGQQFDVTAEGFYQIRVANDGTKNAASAGYRVSSTSIHIRQIS